MGPLPPSAAREFEKLIMAPRGGIEYMAGGTGSHPTIGVASLGRQSKSNTKLKNAGKRKIKTSSPRKSVLDRNDLVIHG